MPKSVMRITGWHISVPTLSLPHTVLGTLGCCKSWQSKIGSIFVLAMMQRSEERGTYDVDADATPQMAADEHLHSEVVRALAARSRARFSGRARAMVFGINDGLVSNLALVAGIAGTGVPVSIVLVTGLTGLVAGALSMGAGEFISITSQRELLESSLPQPRCETTSAHVGSCC
ncbi:VIT family [Mobiluncus curtisii]|uniref:VIT family n=2 Tax=Mobiluncus curtisii TaxID=2051 RepID=A0A2X3BFM9_9ACTO|nr:VIT family [Mobiluncus curtisii]